MIVLSSSLALAACGDDGERSSAVTALGTTSTAVDGTTPQATTTPATTTPGPTGATGSSGTTGATGTATTPADPTGTGGVAPGTSTTEIGPADDGEAIRVPADFTIGTAGVTPSRISVPAFLTIALRVTAEDGRAHTLRIAGPKGPITVAVPAGGTGSKDVEGLPDGTYPIALDGQATDGALVVGGEPGP